MKKFLFTHDTQKEVAKIEPRPSVTGPSTSDEDRNSDLGYLIRNALPEEIADLAKTVRARVDREPKTKWMKCDKCGFAMTQAFRLPDAPCIRCNRANYADGGWLREMSTKDIDKHLADQKKRNEEIAARALRSGLFFRNEERGKAGLEPLNLEQFKAEQKAEFERSQAEFKRSVEHAKKVRERERAAAEEKKAEQAAQEAKATLR